MILALSRFKVVNGTEEAVRDAFVNRPRLVDRVPGFLGLEVFTDSADAQSFYLVTRWTDRVHYEAWHGSAAHKTSHKKIPKGIKLDPEQTEIRLLERIEGPFSDWSHVVFDGTPFVAEFLEQQEQICCLQADREGGIRVCNTAMARIFGIPQFAAIGRSVWAFLAEPDARLLQARLEQGSRAREEQLRLNFLNARQTPETLLCQIDAYGEGFLLLGVPPQKENARLQEELLGLTNELSTLSRENARKGRELERSLKQLKDAQASLVHHEKLAALGQMTAGVAHELNNPIAFVLNNQVTLDRDFADLLEIIAQLREAEPELREKCPALFQKIAEKMDEIELEHIVQSVPNKLRRNLEGLERMKQIVAALRGFARHDQHGFKRCDIREDILAGVLFLTPLAQESEVSVRTELRASAPLLCEAGSLNQAVMNVVANAVQASRPGQVVQVRSYVEGGLYTIEVEDAGEGIGGEDLSRVFEPFFTTKPVGSGTGLGLSIAHQIVRAHKGDIQIESTPGAGTRVKIRIPCEQETIIDHLHQRPAAPGVGAAERPA